MNILRTKHTIVDCISLDDAPFFLALLNSPGWVKYIGDRGVSDIADARLYLQNGFLRSNLDNGFGYYVVRIRRKRIPIGICGFLKKSYLANPDFGFALLPDYCGKGLAFESCRAVLEFGIEKFGFSALDALTTPDNMRSMQLLFKLGFHRYGTVDKDSSDGQLLLYRYRVQKKSSLLKLET